MPVWFITGVSSGIGLNLALIALKGGHKVVATVRSREKSADAVKAIEGAGGMILVLDVTNADAAIGGFKEAEKKYGQVDILVNNAGYSLLGAIEDVSDQEARDQFETNFIAPLRLIRTALPAFRARNAGTIVNLSSVAGLDAHASTGLYASSKFALEGLSESLQRETARFNISVLIVEPGAFRTRFLNSAKNPAKETKDYAEVQEALKKFETSSGKQPGDPVKAATHIYEAITGTGKAGSLGNGKVLRLALGSDAVSRIEGKIKKLTEDLNAAKSTVALTTDCD